MNRWQNRRLLIPALVLVALAGSWLPSRISVTLTPSVKHRLWWLSQDLSRIRHGEYVLLHLPLERLGGLPVPESVIERGSIRAIKRVGCDEGEELRRVGRDFFCGGEFLGRAEERDHFGTPLGLCEFSGTIPIGRVFLVGDHPDSFDSRYFGLVDKQLFLAWARPIF